MTILGVFLFFILWIGVLWVIWQFMPAPFKTPTLVVVVLLGLLYLVLQFMPGVANTRIG